MRSTDEVYGSLAYDGALLLRVPICVSRAFLVSISFQFHVPVVFAAVVSIQIS